MAAEDRKDICPGDSVIEARFANVAEKREIIERSGIVESCSGRHMKTKGRKGGLGWTELGVSESRYGMGKMF